MPIRAKGHKDRKLASLRRQSRCNLKDVLKNYAKPPKDLNFPRAGKEIL